MKIDILVLGEFETNCYILRNNKTALDCLVIDPGLGAGRLFSFLKEHKLNPLAIVLTHGHIDHIGAVAELCDNFPHIKVYIHKLDARMLQDSYSNLSAMMGSGFSASPADFLLDDSSIVDEAGIKLQVLHTPGHTLGGICLYSKDEGIVFTDDTLFVDSIGRTDFPGGNEQQLLTSVREKLFTLSGDTIVYPGHGPSTTIEREKTHNPFFQ